MALTRASQSKIPRRLPAASSSSPVSTPPKPTNTGDTTVTATACAQVPTPPPSSAERANHANHAQHNRRVTGSRVPRLSGGATSGSLYLADHPAIHVLKSHAHEQHQQTQHQQTQHQPTEAPASLTEEDADRTEHVVQQQRHAESTPTSIADHQIGTTDQSLQSPAPPATGSILKPLRLSELFDKPVDHSGTPQEQNQRPRLMRPKTFSISMTSYDRSFPLAKASETCNSSEVGSDITANSDVFSRDLASFMRISCFSHADPSITRSAPAPPPTPSSSNSPPMSHATPSPPTLSHSLSSPSSHTLAPTPSHPEKNITPHTPLHALPFLHARATETRHVLAALESSIASILHMSHNHDRTPCDHAYSHIEKEADEDGYSKYV